MKFQKKHIISAALILALGAAVYVNWQFGAQGAQKSSKELGAASYVNATVGSTCDEAVKTSALSEEQRNFFASERTKRQAAQDKIIDKAKDVLDLDSSTEEEKSEAQKAAAQGKGFFGVPVLYQRHGRYGNSPAKGAERHRRPAYRRRGHLALQGKLR